MHRKEQHLKKGRRSVSDPNHQNAKNGFIFIKKVRHKLIDTFLHHNRVTTAGIFFLYAWFNQFQNICKETTLPELMAVLLKFNEVNKRPSNQG